MGQTMMAVVAHAGRTAQNTFTLDEVPVPILRPRDLLVRVRAVSVNPVDTKMLKRLPDGGSITLGYDAAGVVESVGAEVTGFTPGDEVYYAGDNTRPGTNAELHAVDERIVARKPATLDWAEAAALPLTTITAWESLFERLRLRADSTGTLLIVGGAGGVGSVMIQLARALTGVTVIATASRDDSRAWVRELGADHVAGHRDLVAEVAPLAPDGLDWVFSAHTPGNIEAYASLLRPFGAIVAIDDDPGSILPLKPKAISFHWEYMFTRIINLTPDVAEQGRLLAATAGLVDEGRLRSTLTTTLHGLNPATLSAAHELIGSGSSIGKIALTVQ